MLEIPHKKGIRLVWFDIENMYPNIPSNELVHIIERISYENQLDDRVTKQLIKITRTVVEENYFTFQNQNYFQKTGLWDPITFHGKTSMHNKNIYMIAVVDLRMVIR